MKRILLVDDHPKLLYHLKLTLEETGEYEVLTALDGDEALDLLRAQPVDLIVADIGMPRVNGYQLYEQVRCNAAVPHWAILPFVFLSGRALESDIRFGKALGADDYLTKPVKPEDLLAVIRGKLNQYQRLLALVEQSTSPECITLTIDCHPLRFDCRQRRVWVDDTEISLSSREGLLLGQLVRQANQVVTARELALVTHNLEMDEQEAGLLLRPLIKRLRRKLREPLGGVDCIKNVWGRGYMLIAGD